MGGGISKRVSRRNLRSQSTTSVSSRRPRQGEESSAQVLGSPEEGNIAAASHRADDEVEVAKAEIQQQCGLEMPNGPPAKLDAGGAGKGDASSGRGGRQGHEFRGLDGVQEPAGSDGQMRGKLVFHGEGIHAAGSGGQDQSPENGLAVNSVHRVDARGAEEDSIQEAQGTSFVDDAIGVQRTGALDAGLVRPGIAEAGDAQEACYGSPQQSGLDSSSTSTAVALDNSTLSPAGAAAATAAAEESQASEAHGKQQQGAVDALNEEGGGCEAGGKDAEKDGDDDENKGKREKQQEAGLEGIKNPLDEAENLAVEAGDWVGLVEREMQRCPMFEKLRVVCSSEDDGRMDQANTSNWRRIAASRWCVCFQGDGPAVGGLPIIDAHRHGWVRAMRCTAPDMMLKGSGGNRGNKRPAHLLVCSIKPAHMARLHILSGCLLGRWSAATASFSGNDDRSTQDQFLQLARPAAGSSSDSRGWASPSQAEFWTFDRRRLIASASAVTRGASASLESDADRSKIIDSPSAMRRASVWRGAPLESKIKTLEEQTSKRRGDFTQGLAAWQGVAAHPHIFPLAHVLGPSVSLLPSLVGWVPLRQWTCDPSIKALLAHGTQQRHLGCAFASLQISWALEHLHSPSCLHQARLRTSKIANPFQNPVSTYVQSIEEEVVGDSLCHLDLCPENVVGWIVPQGAPAGDFDVVGGGGGGGGGGGNSEGEARWGDLHVCLCDWGGSAERASWRRGARGGKGGGTLGFRAPEQQASLRGGAGYWESEPPEGVVVLKMGERAVVQVGRGVGEILVDWEHGETGSLVGQGRIWPSEHKNWSMQISGLCEGMGSDSDIAGVEASVVIEGDGDGAEENSNGGGARLVLSNDTGACIVSYFWKSTKSLSEARDSHAPKTSASGHVGQHSDVWSWAMLTSYIFSCHDQLKMRGWDEVLGELDACASDHDGGGSSSKQCFGGLLAPFMCGLLRDCFVDEDPTSRPTSKAVSDRLLSALLQEAGRSGPHHQAVALSLVKPTVSCWHAASGSGLSSLRHLEICQSSEVVCRTLYGPSHHSTLAAANRCCEVLCSRADRESISAALDKWRSLMILCGKAVESQRVLSIMLGNSAVGYCAIGDSESGLRSFNEATTVRSELGLIGEHSAEQAEMYAEKAAILALVGRGEEGAKSQRERVRILKTMESDGRDGVFANPKLVMACAESELACILEIAANYDEAITLHEKAMKTFADAEGNDCLCVKACEGGMQRCTSMMVKQALSGMDPKDWAKEQAMEERKRTRAEAVRAAELREEKRLRELERIKNRGGKVFEHKLEDGQALRIVVEGQMMVDDWDKMNAKSGASKRTAQSRVEGERCIEGAWNALKRPIPAVEQAKFLFERAREAFATAGAADKIEVLKELELKIMQIGSGEKPHEEGVKRVVKGRVMPLYEDASQGYRDGDSDEGYSAEEDSDEEERREQEERKRREEEERERRIAEEKRIDLERQAERERRQNMSLRDMEYERQTKQRKEAGGDQWSSWWNQEMAAVPDKQDYTVVDDELEAKKKAVEEKLREEQRALYEAYLARQNKT